MKIISENEGNSLYWLPFAIHRMLWEQISAMLSMYSNAKENSVRWNILAHILLDVCRVWLVFSPNLLAVFKLCDCHKFLGCVMMGVAEIFFCIFTPSVTLKMEAVCSSKMFDHTHIVY